MRHKERTEKYIAISNQEMIELEAPDELSARIAASQYFCKRLKALWHYQETDQTPQGMVEEAPFYKDLALAKIPQKLTHIIVKAEGGDAKITQKRTVALNEARYLGENWTMF